MPEFRLQGPKNDLKDCCHLRTNAKGAASVVRAHAWSRLCRERVLNRQTTGPNPLNRRDDFGGPALRHGSLLGSAHSCQRILYENLFNLKNFWQ
jgi:hypothetical protein